MVKVIAASSTYQLQLQSIGELVCIAPKSNQIRPPSSDSPGPFPQHSVMDYSTPRSHDRAFSISVPKTPSSAVIVLGRVAFSRISKSHVKALASHRRSQPVKATVPALQCQSSSFFLHRLAPGNKALTTLLQQWHSCRSPTQPLFKPPIVPPPDSLFSSLHTTTTTTTTTKKTTTAMTLH